MKQHEFKSLENIRRNCKESEGEISNYDIWAKLNDIIYDIADDCSTDFIKELWELEEYYKDKCISE